MNRLPQKNTLVITFILVIAYLSLDFWVKGKRDFFQLNYDWSSVKIIRNYENAQIDSVSYNFLRISKANQIDLSLFNSNNTYSINNKHYFKYTSITKNEAHLNFNGVFWINSTPTLESKQATLSQLILPIKQNGNSTVCMIGDSQLTYLEGKYTRKDISQKLGNVKFVGRDVDLFGYPYYAKPLNNSTTILSDLKNIPLAKTYILFIGAHELNTYDIKDNINKIVSYLHKKKSKVILITPPSYANKSLLPIQNIIRETYNQYIDQNNVEVIDLSMMIKESDHFLHSDGIHLNFSGHKMLTEHLIQSLKGK